MHNFKSKVQQAQDEIIRKSKLQIKKQTAYRCSVIAAAVRFAFDKDYDCPLDTSEDSFDDAFGKAEAFLIEYKEHIPEEGNLYSNSHGQHASWSDGKYLDYECDGEIVNIADHWHKPVGTKIVFQTLVDSDGEVIDLYYTVTPSVHNTPNGYLYHWKTQGHVVDAAEDFDYEIYEMNEDNNDHTENAVQIVNLFGTPEEQEEMYDIAVFHTFEGYITNDLQYRRDALVRKYVHNIKNYPHE